MDNISYLTYTVIAKNINRNKLIFSLNSVSPEPSLINIYFVNNCGLVERIGGQVGHAGQSGNGSESCA